jgi:hypothetical protein
VLTAAERNYAPVEVELLAIIELLKAADWLLRKANDIVVITDHQTLEHITAMAHREHGRLARWALRLIEYDLQLFYRRGATRLDSKRYAPTARWLGAGLDAARRIGRRVGQS